MNIEILRRSGARLARWLEWSTAGILAILSLGAQAGGVIIDFGYQVSSGGTPVARAYDDGRRTYLILEGADALEEVPRSAAVIRKGRIESAVIEPSSPYPSIAGVYDRIVLSFGRREAVVTYKGRRGQAVAEEPSDWEDLPLIEVGEKLTIRRIPVKSRPGDEGGAPGPRKGIARRAAPAPVAQEAPESVPAFVHAPAPVHPPAPVEVSAPAQPPSPAQAPAVAQASASPASAPAPASVPAAAPAPVPAPAAAAAPAPAPAPIPAPVPPKAAAIAPAGQPPMDEKISLPDNQVAKIVAPTEGSAAPGPVTGTVLPGNEAAAAMDGELAEYKVQVPFAEGKSTLGKEGEKAMGEVAQIGPIAKEIRIRTPYGPGGDLRRAYDRAEEIHRRLVKAGLRQPVVIETVDAVPDGRIIHAEVALMVDLGKMASK